MAKEYGDAGGLDDLLLVLPNCRNEVAGLKNSKNQIRVKCKTCGSEMVRTIVGRRHDVIDIYAPSGQEHNDLELRRY